MVETMNNISILFFCILRVVLCFARRDAMAQGSSVDLIGHVEFYG